MLYNLHKEATLRNKRKDKPAMTTDQLNHIIEEAERLSDEDLQAAHARIQEMLNDRKWDKLLASPESIAYEKRCVQK